MLPYRFWSTSSHRAALFPQHVTVLLPFLPSLHKSCIFCSSKYASYSRLPRFSRLSILPVLFFVKKFFITFSLTFFFLFFFKHESFPDDILPLVCIADVFLVLWLYPRFHLFLFFKQLFKCLTMCLNLHAFVTLSISSALPFR